MERNSNRKKLLNQLGLTCSDEWVGDKTWSPDLNQRIFVWIPEFFIPERRYRYLAMCRCQVSKLWDVFRKWIQENGYYLDLKKINQNLLIEFEAELPSLGWSRSAIHLIEIVLVRLRQHLHTQKVVWCNSHVSRGAFTLTPEFHISVKDFRRIRDQIFESGNDYEILYFDLYTITRLLSFSLMSLKGRNITFKGDHALIHCEFTIYKNETYICSRQTSRLFLKLLRSRNIVADEEIFGGYKRIHWILEKQIREICISESIPLFAFDSLCGFQNSFSNRIPDSISGRSDVFWENWSPWRRKRITRKHLEVADWIYKYVTEYKAFYQPQYKPHWSIKSLTK